MSQGESITPSGVGVAKFSLDDSPQGTQSLPGVRSDVTQVVDENWEDSNKIMVPLYFGIVDWNKGVIDPNPSLH